MRDDKYGKRTGSAGPKKHGAGKRHHADFKRREEGYYGSERSDRRERSERGGRSERRDWNDRRDRNDRGNRNERGGRYERSGGPGAARGARKEGYGFRDREFAEAPSKNLLYGRNSITEALKSGRGMEKLMIQDGAIGAAGRVLELAKDQGVVIERVSKQALDRMTDGANHQGVCAMVSAHDYAELEDTFTLAKEKGEDPFLVVLDGIEDPGNLGAVMRTAECAGACGVIIQKRRAAGLTEAAAKASCGAVEYLPCVRETNIARTIEELQSRGVWVYACDMDGENYTDRDLTGPVAIVIGAEGNGISPLVKQKCDGVVSIPLKGHINSLNASNAAAVLMYEIRRQRDAAARESSESGDEK